MIHSGIQGSVLLVNIRINRKNLEGTNTVAYFDAVFVAKVLEHWLLESSSIRTVMNALANKLECLSVAKIVAGSCDLMHKPWIRVRLVKPRNPY